MRTVVGLRCGTGPAREIWDLVSGRRQTVIKSAGWTMSLESNPDGTRLATAGGQADPVAKAWDVRTGKLLQEFRGHANTVEHTTQFFRDFGEPRLLPARSAGVGIDAGQPWDQATPQQGEP